jgi:hypothetical protein
VESLTYFACPLTSFANKSGITPAASVGVYLVEQCEALVPTTWCSEQNHAGPVTTGKHMSFHQPMKDYQLLAQLRIFYHQIGSSTS